MKVSEIGEFGLIDVIAGLVSAESKKGNAWDSLIIGMGDDAAAWRTGQGIQLATVDALVQDVHFNLGMVSWEDLGWKSLAVNLSDIAAMGGSPRYALVSLALCGETEVNDIVLFYQGMLCLAREFEVAIIGGNISRAPLVSVSVAVYGDSPGPADRLLTRSTAHVGDKIAVTGSLGAAAGGFEMLSKRLAFDPESMAALRRAFLRPVPRVKEAGTIVAGGVRTAIDISDGLFSDLGHICRASQLGACVRARQLPVARAVSDNFGARGLELALTGGEDYELLFTAPADLVKATSAALEREGCPVTVIGEMTANEARVTVLDEDGKEIDLPKRGWDHLAAG